MKLETKLMKTKDAGVRITVKSSSLIQNKKRDRKETW